MPPLDPVASALLPTAPSASLAERVRQLPAVLTRLVGCEVDHPGEDARHADGTSCPAWTEELLARSAVLALLESSDEGGPRARCDCCDSTAVPQPRISDLTGLDPAARARLLRPTCRDCDLGLGPTR